MKVYGEDFLEASKKIEAIKNEDPSIKDLIGE